MRAEGLPPNVDAVSRAISLCGCELPVAESLFESLVAAGNDSEGAYSCLLRAQLGSGDLDRALVTFRRMLQRGIAPRGRNASPVLHALCAAGRQVDAMRFSGAAGEARAGALAGGPRRAAAAARQPRLAAAAPPPAGQASAQHVLVRDL
eukprot:CAMPEP_0185300344 /NCGR_PEP_ID=MMETSP1363-20130426/11960_1 /TAXON_ID=38817 /ORGANISM="Gephyrocapsa oceanica, Strain RCC1303" /LENGTH=148 /DNA_ID=CAMNT_0027897297 /DNA_START=10 /DNA_END=451 /DNA_ORIENTATION=+